MAGQQGVVGERAIIANLAIVGYVTTHHEKITVTDARNPRLRCATMNGDVLANDIVISDLNAGRLVAVFVILGSAPDNYITTEEIVFTDDTRPDDMTMGPNNCAVAYRDRAVNNRVWADTHFAFEFDLVRNNSSRVDVHRACTHGLALVSEDPLQTSYRFIPFARCFAKSS